MTTRHGSCHCGGIRFEVDTDLSEPMRCNCSFCIRRGAVLQGVPSDRFQLIQGEDLLTRYGSRDFSDHFFCKICGIHSFTRVKRSNEESVVINVGCLEGVDPEALTPVVFDGATLL